MKFYVVKDETGRWLVGVFIDHQVYGPMDRFLMGFDSWPQAMRLLNDLTGRR